MDETEVQTISDAIVNLSPVHLQAILPAGGWSQTPPYTQTVLVEGLLDTDTPIVDVALDDDPETAASELDAYGLVGRVDAEDGQLTAYCYDSAPETELTIRLMVMR